MIFNLIKNIVGICILLILMIWTIKWIIKGIKSDLQVTINLWESVFDKKNMVMLKKVFSEFKSNLKKIHKINKTKKDQKEQRDMWNKANNENKDK